MVHEILKKLEEKNARKVWINLGNVGEVFPNIFRKFWVNYYNLKKFSNKISIKKNVEILKECKKNIRLRLSFFIIRVMSFLA